MNQILKFSELEFDKYISDLNTETHESIHKLLLKEIDLEREEMTKMENQLKQAHKNKNQLLVARFEQKIRESDLQIDLLRRRQEKLERKLKASGRKSSDENKPKPISTNPRPIENIHSPKPNHHSLHHQHSSHRSPPPQNNHHRVSETPVNSQKPTPPRWSEPLKPTAPGQKIFLASEVAHKNNHNPKSSNPESKEETMNHKNTKELVIDTKSLVSKFEQRKPPEPMKSILTKTQSTLNKNEAPVLRQMNKQTQQQKDIKSMRRVSFDIQDLESFNESVELGTTTTTAAAATGPYNVKLKKVGLPVDARKSDQEMYKPDINRTVPVQHKIPQNNHQSTKVTSPKGYRHSIATTTAIHTQKDNYINPNVEIQEKFWKEIKEKTLNPVGEQVQNNSVAISSENLTKGKYDFSGERHLSAINGRQKPREMSASKSMPFLSSSTTNGEIEVEESDDSDQTDNVISPISIEQTDGTGDCSASLNTWDPRPVLNQLYEIKLNPTQKSNGNTTKIFKEYIDIFYLIHRGPKFNNKFVRCFIIINNYEFSIFENSISRIPIDKFELKELQCSNSSNNEVTISDSKSSILKIKFPQITKMDEFLKYFRLNSNATDYQIHLDPVLYEESTSHESKVLIVDLGSCSVRAGVLRNKYTLPALYFPNIAAIDKESSDATAVGLECCNPSLRTNCHIIRLLKPDTTIEDVSFTSGGVEMLFRYICKQLKISPKEYTIMLSVPHNVSDVIRIKLTNVLFYRLNFREVSMCGQSLLALQSYGEPTGLLVDIGYRTELLPVTQGIVQFAGIRRSLLGGHLVQVAMSHLLPFDVHSITDFFLIRYFIEKTCEVAPKYEAAQNTSPTIDVPLNELKLPNSFQKNQKLQYKDRSLPVEGLFNPEIFSLDAQSLPQLIKTSINACPVDYRRKLYQNIFLSGAASQFPELTSRLENELKNILPSTSKVNVLANPNRAHYSYLGACYIANSPDFQATLVTKIDWETSEIESLKKWHN